MTVIWQCELNQPRDVAKVVLSRLDNFIRKRDE